MTDGARDIYFYVFYSFFTSCGFDAPSIRFVVLNREPAQTAEHQFICDTFSEELCQTGN